MKYFVFYLIFVNFITIVFMLVDKHRAIKYKYRIPENILYILTMLGGTFSMVFSMYVFHHKNKKTKFKIVIYAILIFQIIAILKIILFR